ncbi:MAG TPA: hypothetical protein PLU72_11915 [Candidatus Ozemobacteraceae bacterium]|nr:hypothetical protein [Candidatus Ozemobacteraceae bacterium]
MSDDTMNGGPARWAGWACSLLVAAAFVGYAVVLYDAMPESTFDDAYMFVRYAAHLLEGKGIAWNPDGAQVFGATSLPYMLLVAAGLKILPLPPGTILLLLSWSVGLAALLGLWIVGVRNVENSLLRNPVFVGAFLFPLVLVLNIFPMNAVTGMDTTLSFASHVILIGAVLSFCRQPGVGALSVVVLAAGAALAVRPENAVCALLFPMLSIVARRPESMRRWIAAFVAGFALLCLLDGGLKFVLFGQFFPLGAHAKTFASLAGYTGKGDWNHVAYLQDFLTNGMMFFFTLVICVERRSLAWMVAFLAPMAATFACFFTFIPVMGFDARYQCPFLPYLMIGSLLVLDRFLMEKGGWRPWRRNAARFAAACVIFAGFQSPALPESFADRYLRDEGLPPARVVTSASRPLEQLDFWQNIVGFSSLLQRLPRDITIAATEHGYAGAGSPDVPIIDLSGLNSPEYALEEFSADRVMAAKPDLIWLPHPHYTVRVKRILLHPRFLQEYELYEGAFNFGVALARNGPRYGEIRRTFLGVATILYPDADMLEYIVNDIYDAPSGAGEPASATTPAGD